MDFYAQSLKRRDLTKSAEHLGLKSEDFYVYCIYSEHSKNTMGKFNIQLNRSLRILSA